MTSCKIAFFDTKPYDLEIFDEVNQRFHFDIKYYASHFNVDTAILSRDHDVVCVFVNDLLQKESFDLLSDMKIKLIALRCSGFNNVDIESARKLQIPIVRVPKYSPYAVAEHAVCLMLALNRKIHHAYSRVRDNNFSIVGLMGFDMHEKTIGIIGTGNIAKVVVQILKGFGMRVLAYDIKKNEELSKSLDFEYVDLDTLYKESDIISLHCPLTPKSHHLIDRKAINKMKEGVMIINTSRGGLINTYDLIEGLKNRKIGFAGLDVYEEEEEYFFEDLSQTFIPDDILARLQTFPNVLISSHQAFFTREALYNIATTTLENIQDFQEGKPLVNAIS